MTEAWPSGVPSLAVQDSMTAAPFRAPLATDLEDGNRRYRRSVTKNIATVPFSIHMENSEFATFKAWVRDTLVDGTLPFTVPIWDGATYTTKTCTFTQPYQDNPEGGFRHTVSLTLDVEDW